MSAMQTRTIVHLEEGRARLLGPTIARMLYADANEGTRTFAHYSITVGGPFGLDPETCFCALCGGAFGIGPTFAYACSTTSELFRADPRVGKALPVMHGACVRLAQECGVTQDEMAAQLAEEEQRRRRERGDA